MTDTVKLRVNKKLYIENGNTILKPIDLYNMLEYDKEKKDLFVVVKTTDGQITHRLRIRGYHTSEDVVELETTLLYASDRL